MNARPSSKEAANSASAPGKASAPSALSEKRKTPSNETNPVVYFDIAIGGTCLALDFFFFHLCFFVPVVLLCFGLFIWDLMTMVSRLFEVNKGTSEGGTQKKKN